MENIQEKEVLKINGWLFLAVNLIVAGAGLWFLLNTQPGPSAGLKSVTGIILLILAGICGPGYFLVQPNEAKVFTFFGNYVGSNRIAGFFWTNPFTVRRKVSLRIVNFNSETLKVNDANGNPIEIAAVVVWNIADSAKAVFNVSSYQNFVAIQSETAIRQLASHFPYDSHEKDQESLRTDPESISLKLRDQVQARLEISGIGIVDARLTHLAYAPEIAQAMLRRQQAEAIIAARRQIVDGAVGMVDMALKSLESHGVVKLDEEKKASMVNNLLVALVSESEAQPIINTGTLYS